jgi:hypothetical protein
VSPSNDVVLETIVVPKIAVFVTESPVPLPDKYNVPVALV